MVVVRSAHQVVPHDVPSDVTAHRVINMVYCVCEGISGWVPSGNRPTAVVNPKHKDVVIPWLCNAASAISVMLEKTGVL